MASHIPNQIRRFFNASSGKHDEVSLSALGYPLTHDGEHDQEMVRLLQIPAYLRRRKDWNAEQALARMQKIASCNANSLGANTPLKITASSISRAKNQPCNRSSNLKVNGGMADVYMMLEKMSNATKIC